MGATLVTRKEVTNDELLKASSVTIIPYNETFQSEVKVVLKPLHKESHIQR